MNDEQITAEIISVNCIFAGEEGEVFAGTLAMKIMSVICVMICI